MQTIHANIDIKATFFGIDTYSRYIKSINTDTHNCGIGPSHGWDAYTAQSKQTPAAELFSQRGGFITLA